jgi:hypothetical protein
MDMNETVSAASRSAVGNHSWQMRATVLKSSGWPDAPIACDASSTPKAARGGAEAA